MKLFGLIGGGGGMGREVLPLVRAQLARAWPEGGYEVVVVDSRLDPSRPIQGHRVMSDEAFHAAPGERWFNIPIADSRLRERIATLAIDRGAQPFSIAAASAENLADNRIGAGAILCSFSLVTANATVGRFFHGNYYACVAHDVVIGDFVTFAPKAQCNGNIVIEDHAYIGANAVIKQGRPGEPLVIGRGAIVGMGAVVTRSVAPGAVVVGNPARPMRAPGA